MPQSLVLAVGAGIGLFIAYVVSLLLAEWSLTYVTPQLHRSL